MTVYRNARRGGIRYLSASAAVLALATPGAVFATGPASRAAKAADSAEPVVVAQQAAPKAEAPAPLPQTPEPTTSGASNSTEEVVVTGSRIRQRIAETASPLQVVTSQDLNTRGFSTIAQALNELPAFGVPGASPVGFNQSGFGAGQSFVNFLGLGSQRTLTLVNSKRFVSGNTSSIFGPTGTGGGQVDLNAIPVALVERIDLVAGIGAPIYGSDAIAGTINVILKKNYQGFDLDAQAGVSAQGDAPDYRFRAVAGRNFADGRGNITIGAEYDEARGLLFTDRPFTAFDNRFDADPNNINRQIIYNDLRIPSISATGVPLVGGAAFGLDFPFSPQQANFLLGDPTANFGVVNAANQQLRFNGTGGLEAIDFGRTVGAANGFSVFTSGGNGFALPPVQNLLTDSQRYSVIAQVNFKVSPKFRLFGEGWFSFSQGRNLADQPVFNTALFDAAGTRDGNFIIPLSNPFLSTAARAAIQNSITNNPLSDQNLQGVAQDYFYLGRANVDLSPGTSEGNAQTLRFVGGFEGELTLLKGKEWHFEAYFDYGRALTRSSSPQLNERNFRNALDAVRDTSGNIVCRPGFVNSAAPTVSATCAPLNPFGQQISQAARDYVTSIANSRNVNNQYDAVASISGPVVTLPGGDLAFSLGYEHREETSSFDPGLFFFGSGTGNSSQRGSFGRSVPVDPVRGRFFTNEIFGEINAQLISPANGVPFVHELSIQTAGRYIWNSLAGADPTYTFQGRYAPVAGLAFRGAYTRAVRSPSITEAFNPTSSAFGFATDVCDRSQVNLGPAPATRARNCAAAGVPANFVSLSNQRSFPTFVFGNANLRNETSDNFTVGAVLTPRLIPGFTLTVDYVQVLLSNAISQFSNSQVVSACYDAVNFPNNQFCNLVTRDPATFQLNSVGTTFFNSNQLRYKGILAEAIYSLRTDFLGAGSRVTFKASYQYLDRLETVVTVGSNTVITGGGVGFSRHKGIGTLSYKNKGFFTQVQVNYIGSASVDPNTAPQVYSVPRVDAFAYVNLSIGQDIGKNFSIHADVDNLLGAGPPNPFPASGGVTTYFQGILGQYVRVGATVHF